eukprot:m.209773 g.209773  ORF g.209773 m.209773 type:complete len:243 (+) comp33050_c2_seq2:142-870(+)
MRNIMTDILSLLGVEFREVPDQSFDPSNEQLGLLVGGVAWFLFWSKDATVYKWISDAHSIPTCTLAALSLMEVIPEWIPIIFSACYMATDAVVMLLRIFTDTKLDGQSWMFILHHFGVLPLYFHPIIGPASFYANRLSSQVLMIELVNPFLMHWERTNEYSDFVILYIMFVLTRGVYLAYLVYYNMMLTGGPLVWITGALWVSNVAMWLIPNFKKVSSREAYESCVCESRRFNKHKEAHLTE